MISRCLEVTGLHLLSEFLSECVSFTQDDLFIQCFESILKYLIAFSIHGMCQLCYDIIQWIRFFVTVSCSLFPLSAFTTWKCNSIINGLSSINYAGYNNIYVKLFVELELNNSKK